LGEFITISATGTFEPGNYRTDFNASNLASGVYYYSMEYSDLKSLKIGLITKKMVLIK